MEFKPPSDLCINENASENWAIFKQKFNIYLKASENEKKSDEIKVAMLLNCIGDEALHLFNTFELTEGNKKVYDRVIEAFETYCNPRKNVVYNRYKYFMRNQNEGESFNNYYIELKKLARHCEFGEQLNSLLRDKIITGILDIGLQERLLEKPTYNWIKP